MRAQRKSSGITVLVGLLGLWLGPIWGSGFGCTAKASVQRSTPVANLRVYNGVLIRAGASSLERWQAIELRERTAAHLQSQCAFAAVYTGEPQTQPTAEIGLIVDLNVVGSSRGGGGLIQNPNVAVVDVAMALSDSRSDEILGSASIQGRSPAIAISGASGPEQSAIDAVAKQIATILVNSGCTGPRVAEVPHEPAKPVEPVSNEVSPEQAAKAEALSTSGKDAFRAGDAAAAKSKFEAAIALNADPRYILNLCLAQDALDEFEAALATCQRVIDSKADQRLIDKAILRISYINERKSEG